MTSKKRAILGIYAIKIFLLFLMLVSAECDWTIFGGQFTPLWNKQIDIANCYGRFDQGFFQTNLSYVSSNSSQPIVASLGTNQQFLIIYVGNYLNIYDKNLILQTQKSLGFLPVSNPVVMDFYNRGNHLDIATMVKYNSSVFTLKILTYNNNSGTLNISFQENFTGSKIVDGLRNFVDQVRFVYTNSSFSPRYAEVNSSGVIKDFLIPSTNNLADYYTQPVAWWDMDLDGITEVMTYAESNVTIFSEQDGSNVLTLDYNDVTGGSKVLDAHIFPSCHVNFFHLWETDCHVEWKTAVLIGNSLDGSGATSMTMTAYNLDGSVYWSTNIPNFSASANGMSGRFAIDDDYNGDGYADIFVAFKKVNMVGFSVLSGLDGSILAFNNRTAFTSPTGNREDFLTIADMNHDGKNDFIFVTRPYLYVYDIFNHNFIYNSSQNVASSYCIPSDLNLDGYDEILCSGNNDFYEFSSNSTNQNANIVSVTFDPATTNLVVNTPLNVFITANDPESNEIFYYIKCSDNESFVGTSPTANCLYTQIGSYNLTVGVKDFYHDTMNTFSQIITVTQSGNVCGNNICGSGENSFNCPQDCPVTQPTTNTTQSNNGGIEIPTKIVDTENTEQGLLPTIYYGILIFFSNTLVPVMILVFTIIIVLMVLAVGTIIKKIVGKIGG